jgi:hypothetical protein
MTFMAMKIEFMVLWVVEPCSLIVGYCCFGGHCCLCVQGGDGGSAVILCDATTQKTMNSISPL